MISDKDAGCWIDGHWGQYASARLIDLALGYGMPDMTGEFSRAVADYDSNSYPEMIHDMADEAESWLNSVAPRRVLLWLGRW